MGDIQAYLDELAARRRQKSAVGQAAQTSQSNGANGDGGPNRFLWALLGAAVVGGGLLIADRLKSGGRREPEGPMAGPGRLPSALPYRPAGGRLPLPHQRGPLRTDRDPLSLEAYAVDCQLLELDSFLVPVAPLLPPSAQFAGAVPGALSYYAAPQHVQPAAPSPPQEPPDAYRALLQNELTHRKHGRDISDRIADMDTRLRDLEDDFGSGSSDYGGGNSPRDSSRRSRY